MVLVRPARGRGRGETRRAAPSPGRNTSWSIPRWIGRTRLGREPEALDERLRRVREIVITTRAPPGGPPYTRAGRPARRARRTAAGARAGRRGSSSTAGGSSTRGIMTVSGKWSTSRPAKRRATRPPRTDARAIAAMRPGVERDARYSGTTSAGKPVDVGRDRRQEDAVLEPADAPERPDELARVGLASARDPRDEREQADADAHAGDPYGGGRAVHVLVAAGALVPRELGRPREPCSRSSSDALVRLADAVRDRLRVSGVEEHRRVAADLRDRGRVRRGDRAAATPSPRAAAGRIPRTGSGRRGTAARR